MFPDHYYAVWQDQQRGEYPDVTILRSARPKARRAHRCDTCKRPIEQGERYQLDVGTEDGQFFTNRRHAAPCWGMW